MIYLWRTPDKFYQSIIGDDLSRYIGIYNKEKEPHIYNDKAGERRCLLSLSTVFSGYYEGKSFSFSKEKLTFNFDAKKSELMTYDILENDYRFIIVNDRVREVLNRFASKDLEYLEPTILCADGELSGYYVLNIMSRVSGINKEKSKCEFCVVDPNDIAGFEPGIGGMVYNHDCLGKHHIAKEREFGSFVLVSQELKDALCSLDPPLN
jgi:hypothetical protein